MIIFAWSDRRKQIEKDTVTEKEWKNEQQLNEHMNNTEASKCSNQIEGHTDSKLERKEGTKTTREIYALKVVHW